MTKRIVFILQNTLLTFSLIFDQVFPEFYSFYRSFTAKLLLNLGLENVFSACSKMIKHQL